MGNYPKTINSPDPQLERAVLWYVGSCARDPFCYAFLIYFVFRRCVLQAVRCGLVAVSTADGPPLFSVATLIPARDPRFRRVSSRRAYVNQLTWAH